MPLHMHFRWGVTLIGKLSTGLCSPRRGTPFQVQGLSRETVRSRGSVWEESRNVALSKYFVKMYKSFCRTGMETMKM